MANIKATKATIRLTEEMARAGADAVMVVTPSYFKASMNVIQLPSLLS